MKFDDLSPDGQVALAAWAVLLISEPPRELELAGLPCGLTRALGDICKTVGLRGRSQHNNQRRHDVNPRNIRKKLRPAKRKATAK